MLVSVRTFSRDSGASAYAGTRVPRGGIRLSVLNIHKMRKIGISDSDFFYICIPTELNC